MTVHKNHLFEDKKYRKIAAARFFDAPRELIYTGMTDSSLRSKEYPQGLKLNHKGLETIPKSDLKKGKGLHVAFVVTRSPLGYLLAAATAKGLCSVKLGSDKQKLEREFKTEFACAEFVKPDKNFRKWLSALTGYLSGRKPWPRLPYDVQGTEFQKRVWKWLASIPSGKTYYYEDAAAAIGKPKAVRAVASACASNHTALVIPCHRIVPKSGGVGGYRWHPDRKKKLLSIEKTVKIIRRKP